ncbi:hypothetical protein LXA43DRAFT_1087570 [Ganoderma leucocontextum]|nr:hypothetical protein LXA43DRAFT_1087570 [Ganoderma leucocontextum]
MAVHISGRLMLTVEDMLEHLDGMCSSFTLAQLSKLDLSIHINGIDIELLDGPFDFMDVLRSLKRLRALRDISVVIEFDSFAEAAFNVNNGDTDTIASAWPDLAHVKVSHSIDCDDPNDPNDEPWNFISRPSFSAIVSLAERCRKLQSLDIEFEDVSVDELARLEAHADACASPQTALRRIVFGPDTDFRQNLRLADPSRLAAVLQKLFPNLKGGLEMLQEETGEGLARDRGWQPNEMEMDTFRLLRALGSEVHVDG